MVPFGTKLEFLGQAAAEWYKVVYNGVECYAYAEYLTADDVTGSSFTALDQPVTKYVTTDKLTVRTSPWRAPNFENAKYFLDKGDAVTCVAISEDGYWYRIEYRDGGYYYVAANCLSGYADPSNPSTPADPKPTVTFTQLSAPTLMYTINKTGGVRVYSSPDMLTTPATTLAASTAVYCVEISTDQVWFKVTLAGQPNTYYYILVADLQTGGK